MGLVVGFNAPLDSLGKESLFYHMQENEWAPGPDWKLWRSKTLVSTMNRISTWSRSSKTVC